MLSRLAVRKGLPALPEFPNALNISDWMEAEVERFAVLDELSGWIEAHRELMTARGLVPTPGASPLDGRDKRSVWLDVESAEHLGRLIVWDTGEAELELADVPTGGISAQRRRIETRADLDQALALLVAWVDPGA